MTRFAYCDTKRPDGFYVQFVRAIEPDDRADPPDEMQDGFWPSRNPDDAGYVGEVSDEKFAEHEELAKEVMRGWRAGDWQYVGVRAKATCLLVRDGVGTYINLESPGVWGIESNSGDYLDEVFREECEVLKGMIEAMRTFEPVYEMP